MPPASPAQGRIEQGRELRSPPVLVRHLLLARRGLAQGAADVGGELSRAGQVGVEQRLAREVDGEALGEPHRVSPVGLDEADHAAEISMGQLVRDGQAQLGIEATRGVEPEAEGIG